MKPEAAGCDGRGLCEEKQHPSGEQDGVNVHEPRYGPPSECRRRATVEEWKEIGCSESAKRGEGHDDRDAGEEQAVTWDGRMSRCHVTSFQKGC